MGGARRELLAQQCGVPVAHHMPHTVCLLQGSRCLPAFGAAAERAAAALSCYEGAPAPALPIAEGEEPAELLRALRGPADTSAPRTAQAECDAYSKEYQVNSCSDAS